VAYVVRGMDKFKEVIGHKTVGSLKKRVLKLQVFALFNNTNFPPFVAVSRYSRYSLITGGRAGVTSNRLVIDTEVGHLAGKCCLSLNGVKLLKLLATPSLRTIEKSYYEVCSDK